PLGRTDIKRTEKLRRWMTWRVKISLLLFKKLYQHLLQKWVFGSSIAYVPWTTKKRLVKEFLPVQNFITEQITDPISGLPSIRQTPTTRIEEREREVVEFDGPDFILENLEDWILPASAASSDLEDLDHFIRRIELSVDDIL